MDNKVSAEDQFDLHPEDVLTAVRSQPTQVQDAILWRAAALTERRKTGELQRALTLLAGTLPAEPADVTLPPGAPPEVD